MYNNTLPHRILMTTTNKGNKDTPESPKYGGKTGLDPYDGGYCDDPYGDAPYCGVRYGVDP